MGTERAPSLATVLFTDLVDSTATRTRLGEERADELRKIHDELIGRCVKARGGRVVRGLGDGVLAVFPSASDALTAAVETQQALVAYGARRDAIAPLPVRMGLSVGDVSWDGDDCFGTPLVEAARIMAVAGGGQILCSDFVRAMARGRGGHTFADLGFFDMKGLPEPLAVCEVQWEPAPQVGAAAQRPFPPELVVHSALAFVGRDEELDVAARHLAGDRFACLWLIGEPGIGKTRLAAELAEQAHAGGADVLTGRCDEDLVVPFQPIATALRQYVEGIPPPEVAAALGRYPAELARLVPHLASVVSGGQPGPVAQHEVERYRLFEAVRSWLLAAATRRPVLLVLDDLHWADPATVGLLGHLARSADPVPLHVVGTIRDTELSSELQGLLDEFAGRPDAKAVPLAGLSEAGVSQLVETVVESSGGAPATDTAAMVRRIHTETAGNPLFVAAVLSGLEKGEGPDGLPRDVVAAVRRRVVRLPAPTQELLRLGALCGLEFDPRVLARVAGIPAGAALDRLDQAGQARLVEEAAAQRYRFAHAVVRDVLRQQVGPSRAAELHRQVGEAVEAIHHDRLNDHVAELAYHFGEAAAGGGPVETALRYLGLAAEMAAGRYAADTAVNHYRRIVALLEAAGETGGHRLAAALVGLGESLWHSGRFDEAFAVLRRAAVEADACGRPELAAEAAIQFESAGLWTGAPGEQAVGMLMRAQAGLPDDDSPLRTRVLISLGRALGHTTRFDEAVPVLEEAIAMARQLGDDTVLTWALLAVNQTLTGPRHLSWRARASEEARRLARRLDNPRLQRNVAVTTGMLQLELGAIDAVCALIDEAAALRREVPDPHWAYEDMNLASTAALLQARIDMAEQLADAALRAGRALPGLDPDGVYGVQMFSLRREQGRLAEVAPALTTIARLDRPAAWYPGLAALYTELGMVDEARDALVQLVSSEGVSLAHDSRRGLSLSYLAEAAAFVGDAARAEVLYRELEPYADSWISMHVVACQGPASRYLGLLAAVDPARYDAAVSHLEDALARSQAVGSPLWAAHAAYDLATVLVRRGQSDDAARAESLARDAREAAARFGMNGLARRAERLLTTA